MFAVDEASRLIRVSGVDQDLDAPADEALITAVERRLALRFPPSYRKFLSEAGSGGVGSEEFYGIVPHADLTAGRTPNAVWLFESATRRGQPARYFQVYDYGDGTGVALDLERPDSDGETPCVAAHAGDWGAPEDVALNFGTFFLTIVREVLED